jgi:hypothetical protein
MKLKKKLKYYILFQIKQLVMKLIRTKFEGKINERIL